MRTGRSLIKITIMFSPHGGLNSFRSTRLLCVRYRRYFLLVGGISVWSARSVPKTVLPAKLLLRGERFGGDGLFWFFIGFSLNRFLFCPRDFDLIWIIVLLFWVWRVIRFALKTVPAERARLNQTAEQRKYLQGMIAKLGRAGEKMAAHFLKTKGYKLLAAGWKGETAKLICDERRRPHRVSLK